MPYLPNIPQPTDNLSDSQSQILGNFQQLDTTMGVNHFNFSDATANNGKHQFVEIPTIAGLPPGVVANEGTLYTRLINSKAQLFYTPDATGNQYQLTRTDDTTFNLMSSNTNYDTNSFGGWTFLPGARGAGAGTDAGGMLFQYGIYTGSTGGNGTVNFPRPFVNKPFSVTTTMIRTSSNTDVIYVRSVSLASFNFRDTSSGNSFYWMAIGT